MLIDTHAHIYLEDYLHDIDEVLQRAYDNGVKNNPAQSGFINSQTPSRSI